VRDIEKRVIESVAFLEDRVIDAERKTLWRISDCEQILKTKITEVFVNDSLRAMEDKLKREVVYIPLCLFKSSSGNWPPSTIRSTFKWRNSESPPRSRKKPRMIRPRH
jgi:hypothetical protein